MTDIRRKSLWSESEHNRRIAVKDIVVFIRDPVLGLVLMNEQLLARVLKSPRLPSLPSIAIEVINLVQNQDINIKQIAMTISHDPAMASKVLRTVNSSFYGLSQPVSTITHALVILGLNSVKTLALGFSLVNNLKESGAIGFDHMTFWKRSLYSAVAARSLARELGIPQQEEAFLGGLLQDLGVLAMSQTLGPDYGMLVMESGQDHRKLLPLCRAKFQTDHAEIGGALAEAWKLPPILVAAIRHHEDPDRSPGQLRELVRCVAMGGRAADAFILPDPNPVLENFVERAMQWFNMPITRVQPLILEAHRMTVELGRLFDLPAKVMENSGELLSRANDVLLQISLQQEQKSTQLEEQNRQLAVQALTDSLTGAANRRRFNEFIIEQFNACSQTRKPLSVLFFDADNFKKFNDTYGHQTGDRVLVELAATISRTMPAQALVARYGGEEFAVVLPDTDRITASRLAEQCRNAVQTTKIIGDNGEELFISASIGVATYDGSFFERPEQLLKAADQGVYAAKTAGRNCVRVFTPRSRAHSAA